MLLCPAAIHTSPTSTSDAFASPEAARATSSRDSLEASNAGSSVRQAPVASAVAPAVRPPNETVTRSPGAAAPHTRTGQPRCSTAPSVNGAPSLTAEDALSAAIANPDCATSETSRTNAFIVFIITQTSILPYHSTSSVPGYRFRGVSSPAERASCGRVPSSLSAYRQSSVQAVRPFTGVGTFRKEQRRRKFVRTSTGSPGRRVFIHGYLAWQSAPVTQTSSRRRRSRPLRCFFHQASLHHSSGRGVVAPA